MNELRKKELKNEKGRWKVMNEMKNENEEGRRQRGKVEGKKKK